MLRFADVLSNDEENVERGNESHTEAYVEGQLETHRLSVHDLFDLSVGGVGQRVIDKPENMLVAFEHSCYTTCGKKNVLHYKVKVLKIIPAHLGSSGVTNGTYGTYGQKFDPQ